MEQEPKKKINALGVGIVFWISGGWVLFALFCGLYIRERNKTTIVVTNPNTVIRTHLFPSWSWDQQVGHEVRFLPVHTNTPTK